jgi:hypothetical protein
MYVFFILYADGIGVGLDVGKNGTFNSALAWLLSLVPFEVALVLQQEFVAQNVLLQPDYYVLNQFFHGRFGGLVLAPVPYDSDANWKVGEGLNFRMY